MAWWSRHRPDSSFLSTSTLCLIRVCAMPSRLRCSARSSGSRPSVSTSFNLPGSYNRNDDIRFIMHLRLIVQSGCTSQYTIALWARNWGNVKRVKMWYDFTTFVLYCVSSRDQQVSGYMQVTDAYCLEEFQFDGSHFSISRYASNRLHFVKCPESSRKPNNCSVRNQCFDDDSWVWRGQRSPNKQQLAMKVSGMLTRLAMKYYYKIWLDSPLHRVRPDTRRPRLPV